jgi:hypothetical protein
MAERINQFIKNLVESGWSMGIYTKIAGVFNSDFSFDNLMLLKKN